MFQNNKEPTFAEIFRNNKSSEKYILVKFMRNIRRENPDNCQLIFEEKYNLNLFSNTLKMGEVYVCN